MELKRKQSARSAVTHSRSKCQKYSLHIFSGLLFSVFSTLAAAALDRVGDLALLDDDGHSESARYLDPSNLQTLVCWINSRTPRGDSAV